MYFCADTNIFYQRHTLHLLKIIHQPMKRKLLLTVCALVCTNVVFAQRPDNYKPDNPNVTLTQTNLPIVFIDVAGKQIDRKEKITAKVKIIDNGKGKLNYADTVTHKNQRIDYEGYIALKYRGNSSFTSSDKKPYSIRTLDKPLEQGGKKKNVSILGMGKDNDWALLAPYSDKSMIRDILSFTLARPYFEYVPHTRLCEVILDETYYGVYIMSERVGKGKNRLNLPSPGTQGDALTGGYLLEVDRADETVYTSKHHPYKEYGVEVTDKYIYYQSKSMDWEEMTTEQRSYIEGRIDEMEAAFAAPNYTDPNIGYRKYIDVTSFIDYQLSTEFAHNNDGYRLSTNLYKRRDSENGRFKTSLWDMNIAFGNVDYYNGWRTNTWVYNLNKEIYQQDNNLIPFYWQRLQNDPEYIKELKERWKKYREEAYSDAHIAQVIDSLTHLLNDYGAQQRNSQAWPRWGKYVWPNKFVANSYDEEIAYIKQWITRRLAFMDKKLLNKHPETEPNIITVAMKASWNADVVAEKEPVSNALNSGLDHAGWALYTETLQEDGGLPADGIVISRQGITYQLANFERNNALKLNNSNQTYTLQPEKEVQTDRIYILSISANGKSALNVKVNYTDGTASTTHFDIADWFSDLPAGDEAVYGLGRVSQAGAFDGRVQFRLFENEMATNKHKKIASITFTNTANGTCPTILGVSVKGDETTKIDKTTVRKQVKSIYTIDGRQVEQLQKGINLVRYTDGTVSKMLVK